MRLRTAVTGVSALALLLAGAGAADAGPNGLPPWEDAGPTGEPFSLRGCDTTLRVTTLVDETEVRVVEEDRGNTYVAFRGILILEIAARDGRRTVVDASGSAELIDFANGDLYFSTRGGSFIHAYPYERDEFRAAGLPPIFYFEGPQDTFAVLERPPARKGQEPRTTILNAPDPDDLTSICDLLEAPDGRQGAATADAEEAPSGSSRQRLRM